MFEELNLGYVPDTEYECIIDLVFFSFSATCKRKEESQPIVPEHSTAPKKPRLVFTDLQRRTLQAIFKVGISVILNK